VFAHDGRFELFYTGRYFTSAGERREVICRALSDDLIHWHKVSEPISAPNPRRYRLGHWRDPFVLWNPEDEVYWMIVTAELRDAPTGRGGCIALLTSHDLQHWEPAGELMAPHDTTLPECPDLFRWNDWWYLLYSANGQTRYRRARSLSGPWLNERYDAFDGRLFYAAKSAGHEGRRLLFGWLGDKNRGQDDGRMEWGGDLVVRELHQDANGFLVAGQPGELYRANADSTHRLTTRLGRWSSLPHGVRHEPSGAFGYTTTSPIGADLQAQLTIRPSGSPRAFGLVIRTTEDLAGGYMLRLDLSEHRLSLASINSRTGRLENAVSRPWTPQYDEFRVQLTACRSIIDVDVDGRDTLVGRFGKGTGGTLALFADGCPVEFDDVRVIDLNESH
jgi:beta-fructofuranosidase